MPVMRIDGREVGYALSGPSGAQVVAFSNPLGTTMAVWDAVLPALRGRYRVLRYDTRGHGASTAVDEPISVGDLAGDLAKLMDALGVGRAHLVGLSLGGMVMQALASAEPERVLSLTLIATAAHLPSEAAWDARAALVRREGTAAIAEGAVARWFSHGFRERAPAAVAAVREALAAGDRVGYAICCEAIARMDLRPVLHWITAPALVIAGREDTATPPALSEEICAGIRRAELVLLPRAAYLLPVERPEAVSAYLGQFLDRCAGAAAASSPASSSPAASSSSASSPAASPRAATGAVAFADGLANRKGVLGAAHVERSLAGAGAFAGPWQDFITRTAWGEVWGDTRLPWKTRSLVTLALMVALGREEEFKLHVRPALRNGVDLGEFQALLLQTAIYAGVPAANAAFRWVREVLGEELDG